jgi:xylulokinase
MASTHVLALDLGTSRIKVAVVDETLRVIASASASHSTITHVAGMAEQSPFDWLEGIRSATSETLGALASPVTIEAVVLTAQMPTLVTLSSLGTPLGNAVTWQDARSDDLVLSRLSPSERRRVYDVAGTPIDGRYIIPMHLRRRETDTDDAAMLLSAKDYLYFVLTGELVTDPSTASGFGAFDLATLSWSRELTQLWAISPDVLPPIVDPRHHAGLSTSGADLLGGVAPGTPVVVGAADSVCAHHFVTTYFDNPISVIDGSSSVILASLTSSVAPNRELLLTPLVTPSECGAELDLLATGSSLAWLARLLDVAPGDLELLALSHPHPALSPTLFFPYLAGGEQGAIWRGDVTGSVTHLSLGTSRADLASALFEGIAFETARCVRLLEDLGRYDTVVAITGTSSHLVGAAILDAVLATRVVPLSRHSPSLLGAALVGLAAIGATITRVDVVAGTIPALSDDYRAALVAKFATYLENAPAPNSPGGVA